MKARLTFVPPGGGEADYSLDFELNGVPSAGDAICISRKDQQKPGYETFIVRRTWWFLEYPDSKPVHMGSDAPVGKTESLMVECEFARGPYMVEEHARALQSYESRGKVQAFDDTAY